MMMSTKRFRPLHRLLAAGAALALLALSGCVAYPGGYYGGYYGGPYYAPAYGYAYGGPSFAFSYSGGGGGYWHHWH